MNNNVEKLGEDFNVINGDADDDAKILKILADYRLKHPEADKINDAEFLKLIKSMGDGEAPFLKGHAMPPSLDSLKIKDLYLKPSFKIRSQGKKGTNFTPPKKKRKK